MTRYVLANSLPTHIQKAIARLTFPTKKETAAHYDICFTDNVSYWRVLAPWVKDETKQVLFGAIEKYHKELK